MDLITCPVCKSDHSILDASCNCGYDFKRKEITDKEKFRNHYNLQKRTNWIEEVRLIRAVHETQSNKHNYTAPGQRGGWKLEHTAELLGLSKKSKGQISELINLAHALDYYHDLKEYENKSQALESGKRLLECFPLNIKWFKSEKALQHYFENNWNKTPFNQDWEIYKSQFNTKEVGKIDLLAKHRVDKDNWLIIELKKAKNRTDKTIGQILKYMGWVKKHKAGNYGYIEGAIISGFPPYKDIEYASLIVPNIKQHTYSLVQNNVKFFEKKEFETLMELINLPFEKRLKIFENNQNALITLL